MEEQQAIQREIDKLWKEFHAIGEKERLTIADTQKRTRISFDVVKLEMELAKLRVSKEMQKVRKVS